MNCFESKKRYLMRHKHYAFGGGVFEVRVDEIAENMVKLNGHWHMMDRYLKTREIIQELSM